MTNNSLIRWWVYFVGALGVSVVPLYGFCVRAAQDSQNVLPWLLLAWLISLVNAINCFVHSSKLLKTTRFLATISLLVSTILVILLVLGCCGIRNAVVELWAG